MLVENERFTLYLDSKLLPINTIDIRTDSKREIIFVLASHAPSPGLHYSPVNDLIVSIVLQSNYGNVVRDIGYGQKSFKETPDCILVTPPMTPSYWCFEGTPQVMHICFPQDYLQRSLVNSDIDIEVAFEQLARNPIRDPLISMLAKRLWTMSAISSRYSQLCGDQILNTILITLFVESEISRNATCGSQRLTSGLAPWRLRRSTELMEKNIPNNISIDSLAMEVGLSTQHFLRAFTASTGQTPHQWLMQKRIERAKILLGSTTTSITEISMELGFSSPAHFSGSFRQAVGVTPRTWRKEFTTPK